MKRVVLLVCVFVSIGVLAQEENHLKGEVMNEEGSVNAIEGLSQKVASLTMEVNVYPNPSQGQVIVEGGEGSTVTVYSSEGTYVGTWLIGTTGKTEITDLPQGAFICTVQEGTLRTVKRIVVL
jgi:hypothetical protein